MQIVIDISDKSLVDKIIWFLESFKDRGVEIITKSSFVKTREAYSDKYLEENWKELLMTTKDNSHYYKSDDYYEDRAKEYQDREKI